MTAALATPPKAKKHNIAVDEDDAFDCDLATGVSASAAPLEEATEFPVVDTQALSDDAEWLDMAYLKKRIARPQKRHSHSYHFDYQRSCGRGSQ